MYKNTIFILLLTTVIFLLTACSTIPEWAYSEEPAKTAVAIATEQAAKSLTDVPYENGDSGYADISIQVIPSEDQRIQKTLPKEVIPVNNCHGTGEVVNEIEFSETILRIADIDSTIIGTTEGEFGIPGIGNVRIGASIAEQYGVTYGSEKTVRRTISLTTQAGTRVEHTVQPFEIWETGEIVITRINQEEIRYPYEFRTGLGFELIEAINLGCGTP
jgi:hypothetical protein